MSESEYKSSPSGIMRTIQESRHVQEKLRALAEAIEKGEPAPPPSAPTKPDIAPAPADGGRENPSPVSDTRPAGGAPGMDTTESKP